MASTTYTVGALAKLAKLSVRALHHYDAIGLLTPSGRSEAGYRLYTSADLERLQHILFFRELGFALEEIRRIMLDPGFDRRRALEAQRSLLAEKARRTEGMLASIDETLTALEKGTTMNDDDMFEVFGDFNPADYEEEVKQRWGDTDAYAESARRTATYTKADWQRIQAESAEISAAFVDAMRRGLPAESPEALAAAERHYEHLCRYFYTPPLEMYAGLADLWVNDPRFTKNIDKAGVGLAAYQRAAVSAYVKAKLG